MREIRKATFALLLILFALAMVKQACGQTVQVSVTSSDGVLSRSVERQLRGWLSQTGAVVADSPGDYLILVFVEPTGPNAAYAMTSFIGRQSDCSFTPRTGTSPAFPMKLACLAVDEFKTISIVRPDQIAGELRDAARRFSKMLERDKVFFRPAPVM
jgi:hypothetical protein